MRVALLTNMIPPYHKPVYSLLAKRFGSLRFFISTPMEDNRPWQPEWGDLDVVVQKGFTLRRVWRHPRFGETRAIHFPMDTVQQLSHFAPDAVISVEMGFRTLLAWLYVKLHAGCRLFIWSEVTGVTERGRGKLRKVLRRFIVGRTHGFFAVGAGGVRYLQSLGVARERIFQIAYSTNLQPFLEIPLRREWTGQRRLLFSGQLVERKGLVPFVETLNRWARRHQETEIEFSIVGGGPVRAILSAFSLPENVKLLFIGTLEYHELPPVYAHAEIFVLPTLADTWAVVVNEAMASGLPVLGSLYSQAVQEMVEDGTNGWTYRPDEAEEMYRAVDRALSTPAGELSAMGERARRRALEVTPENTAAVCEQALRK